MAEVHRFRSVDPAAGFIVLDANGLLAGRLLRRRAWKPPPVPMLRLTFVASHTRLPLKADLVWPEGRASLGVRRSGQWAQRTLRLRATVVRHRPCRATDQRRPRRMDTERPFCDVHHIGLAGVSLC